MTRSLAIPYFECQEETRSYQACLLMALQFVLAVAEYTLDDMDRLARAEPGRHPWPPLALAALQKEGWEAAYYTNFAWEKYSRTPKEQLGAVYGKEGDKLLALYPVAEICQKHLAELIKIKSLFNQRLADLAELRQLLNAGWQLIVGLNGKALKGEKGFSQRFVIITGLDDKTVVLHDPVASSGGKAGHKVGHDLFLKAWRYPGEQGELVALRQALTPIVA